MDRRAWILIIVLLAGVAVALMLRSQRMREAAPPLAPPPPTQTGPAASPAQPAGAVPDLAGREIKVGSDTTYPPFETVDANKNIVGFDPDLMAEICRRANCKSRFITAAWDGIF